MKILRQTDTFVRLPFYILCHFVEKGEGKMRGWIGFGIGKSWKKMKEKIHHIERLEKINVLVGEEEKVLLHEVRHDELGKRIRSITFFITLLLSIILGATIGYVAGKAMSHVARENKTSILVIAISLAVGIYIVHYVHMVIHELGHLVAGLLSGYGFISYRIGSFIWVKENGRIRLKRYALPGTAGEAMMMPPVKKQGTYPYLLYSYGGIIANFLVAILAMILFLLLRPNHELVVMFLVLFTLIGFFIGLYNVLPLQFTGTPTDGCTVRAMIEEGTNRDAFYSGLSCLGLLSQGKSWQDIPRSVFFLGNDVDYSNPLCSTLMLHQIQYYYDRLDFKMANKLSLKLGTYYSSLMPSLKLELIGERMFLELVGQNRKEVVEAYYTRSLRNYLTKSQYSLSHKRICMAYEVLYEHNKEKAYEIYSEAMALAEQAPYKGDVFAEVRMLNYIRDCIM